MNCHDCDSFLNDQLDGALADLPPALAEHLAGCTRCRELEQAARWLRGTLPALPVPAPPSDLSQRIVAGVLAERRARRVWRYRLTVAAAAAAVVLILVPVLSRLWPTTPPNAPPAKEQVEVTPPSAPVPTPEPQDKTGPSLKSTLAEATQAVVSLSDQLAGQTKKQAQWLLNAELPPMGPLGGMGESDAGLEPARNSLHNVTANVGTGLQSVTQTAQQAVDYFRRELPSFGPKSNKGS
jgi:hypothetical protein